MVSPNQCRFATTSFSSWPARRLRMCSMIGRFATGTRGLGISCVSGRSRVPRPAAMTIAFIGVRLLGSRLSTMTGFERSGVNKPVMSTVTDQDYKVADLGLADFGRKEITLAEHEMPGLMRT